MKKEEINDVLFDIDMQLYDEFNDKICEINEHLGDTFSLRDVEEIEKAQKEKEIKLLRKAVQEQQKEIKKLKQNSLEIAITNEEKEVIEEIKNGIRNPYYSMTHSIFVTYMQILLNLINKQQEVIEQLNISDTSKELSSMNYYNLYKELNNKIKELKQLIHKTLDNNGITRGYQIVIDDYFDKLLGETND